MVARAVAQPEIDAVLDERAPVAHDAIGHAHRARREFVMHGGARGLRDEAAGVVHAREQVGLVEKILVFLVEAAKLQQRPAPERAIRAEQMRELRREREVETRRRPRPVRIGVAEPVDGDEARLEPQARGVVDDAAGGGDVGIFIGLVEIGEPFGLGYRVVVEKGDDLSRRQPDPDVARAARCCAPGNRRS